MEKCFELTRELRVEQGFELYVVNNEKVEIAVVPELGAKVISLRNLQTGREWMWRPADGLKLFRNRPGDDFSRSPLVGLDECLPTIAPCIWQKRKLADHGEVWNRAWDLDHDAWQTGRLKTSVALETAPFDFERAIELHGAEVRLKYRLKNRSASEEQFLWSLHPLLRLCPGDRLVLPASTRALLNGENWIDRVDSAVPTGGCSKLFACPLRKGSAAVHSETGERLEFEWNPAENNTLGVWLTRGGWHGYHHLAIEPTNAGFDALEMAARENRCGIVPASGTRVWEIRLRLTP